jgi:hypothetical protein
METASLVVAAMEPVKQNTVKIATTASRTAQFSLVAAMAFVRQISMRTSSLVVKTVVNPVRMGRATPLSEKPLRRVVKIVSSDLLFVVMGFATPFLARIRTIAG